MDDDPPDSRHVSVKLSWMGLDEFAMTKEEWSRILEAHYIQCRAFQGEEDPEGLADLIDLVGDKLQSQDG